MQRVDFLFAAALLVLSGNAYSQGAPLVRVTLAQAQEAGRLSEDDLKRVTEHRNLRRVKRVLVVSIDKDALLNSQWNVLMPSGETTPFIKRGSEVVPSGLIERAGKAGQSAYHWYGSSADGERRISVQLVDGDIVYGLITGKRLNIEVLKLSGGYQMLIEHDTSAAFTQDAPREGAASSIPAPRETRW